MEYLLAIIIILIALLIMLLFMRVRIRLELTGDRRILFFGLGRSGPELDFRTSRTRIRLFGLSVATLRPAGEKEKAARRAKKPEAKEEKKPRERKARKRSYRELLQLLPRILRGSWGFLVGLVKDAIVEEAEAEIEGGFEEPHLTGQAFGYYQAALAAAPGLLGRVSYVPDWSGASFEGSLRISIAWPLYRMLYRIGRLMVLIRIMNLIRMAIGTREGGSDVKQRS